MCESVEYLLNKASAVEIVEHLSHCDANFSPILSGRVEITEYAKKITSKASRFEAWSKGVLIGLVAIYCNDSRGRIAYITSVSVLLESMGKGVASRLITACISYAESLGFQWLELEVDHNNIRAISLYEKKGFITDKVNDCSIIMRLDIRKES